ncbi:MAG: FkbM family methyltransferase [Deltaproteobacteria bacterium]|nr:FkbM family methyltransferase [Deltaproteobacteria bacterium]
MFDMKNNLHDTLQHHDGFVVFGAGAAGQNALRKLRELEKNVLFVCDNNSALHGTVLDGIDIVSPQKLKTMKDKVVLIASDYAKEIDAQLQQLEVVQKLYFGFCANYDRWVGHFDAIRQEDEEERIQQAAKLFSDKASLDAYWGIIRFRASLCASQLMTANYREYLHPRALPQIDGVIVDGGAWHGDSVETYLENTRYSCHIFSFEPEHRNFLALTDKIKALGAKENITPVQQGLWSDTTTLSFATDNINSMEFSVSTQGDMIVEVTSLDDFFLERDNFPTMIKMDIEGAEIQAIKGAVGLIQKYKPVLQICVYHQYNDLWEIPLLIHSINPLYTFYLGHHSQTIVDTVLYAV